MPWDTIVDYYVDLRDLQQQRILVIETPDRRFPFNPNDFANSEVFAELVKRYVSIPDVHDWQVWGLRSRDTQVHTFPANRHVVLVEIALAWAIILGLIVGAIVTYFYFQHYYEYFHDFRLVSIVAALMVLVMLFMIRAVARETSALRSILSEQFTATPADLSYVSEGLQLQAPWAQVKLSKPSLIHENGKVGFPDHPAVIISHRIKQHRLLLAIIEYRTSINTSS